MSARLFTPMFPKKQNLFVQTYIVTFNNNPFETFPQNVRPQNANKTPKESTNTPLNHWKEFIADSANYTDHVLFRKIHPSSTTCFLIPRKGVEISIRLALMVHLGCFSLRFKKNVRIQIRNLIYMLIYRLAILNRFDRKFSSAIIRVVLVLII